MAAQQEGWNTFPNGFASLWLMALVNGLFKQQEWFGYHVVSVWGSNTDVVKDQQTLRYMLLNMPTFALVSFKFLLSLTHSLPYPPPHPPPHPPHLGDPFTQPYVPGDIRREL